MALDSDKYIFYYDADYIQEGYYEQELYFDGDYLAAGYFEGEQVVQESAADLVATVTLITEITVFVPASADLQSTATQTSTVGKLFDSEITADALFSPNIEVEVRKNAVAILDSVTDIETDADLIADILKTLESIVNVNLQAEKFTGIDDELASQSVLSADSTRTRSTPASLDSQFQLDIEFIVEYSADLEAESTAFARPTVFQEKPLTRDTTFVDNTTNGEASISIASDSKFGSGSVQKDYTETQQGIGTPVWDGTEYKIFGAGHTLTSTDGYNWTKTSNNLTRTAQKPKFIDNQYVFFSGGGDEAEFFTSSDGVNWQETEVTLADFGLDFFGFSFANHEAFKTGGYWWIIIESNDRLRFYRNSSISESGWTGEANYGATNNDLGNSAVSNGELYIPFSFESSSAFREHRVAIISDQRGSNLINVSSFDDPDDDGLIRQAIQTPDNEWIVSIAPFSKSTTDYYLYNSSTDPFPDLFRETDTHTRFDIINDTFFYYSFGNFETETGSTRNATARQDIFLRQGQVTFQNGKYFGHDSDYNIIYISDDAVNWDSVYIGEVASHLEYSNSELPNWKAIDFHFKWQNPETFAQIPLISFGNLQIILEESNSEYGIREIDSSNWVSLSDNVWHNARIQQTNNNQFKFYLNGSLVGSVNKSLFTSDTIRIHSFTAGEQFDVDRVFVDEFVVSKEYLHPYSNNSYSVPTQEFTNTEDLALLLHFNNSFEDDAVLDVVVEANLPSVSTLNADSRVLKDINSDIQSDFEVAAELGVIKQQTADLESEFSSSATATRAFRLESAQNAQFFIAADVNITQAASADFTASFEQTTQNLRIKQGNIETDAVATALTAAAKTGNFLVTLEAFTTLDAVTRKRTGVVVEFDADFAQTTQESRFRGFLSTQNSQFELAASGDRIRFATEELETTVTLAVTELKILGLRAVLESNAEFTGTVNGLFKAEAELDSQATVTISSTAFNEVPAELNAVASLDITSGVQFTLEQTELASAFTQTTEAREFVFLDELVYEIRGEDRTYRIPSEQRTYTILEEDRTWRIL